MSSGSLVFACWSLLVAVAECWFRLCCCLWVFSGGGLVFGLCVVCLGCYLHDLG